MGIDGGKKGSEDGGEGGIGGGGGGDETEDENVDARDSRGKSTELGKNSCGKVNPNAKTVPKAAQDKSPAKKPNTNTRTRTNPKIKSEHRRSTYSASSSSTSSSAPEDSEDEMPLAKLRKTRLGPIPASVSRCYVSPYSGRVMGRGGAGVGAGGVSSGDRVGVGSEGVPASMAAFGLGSGEGFGFGGRMDGRMGSGFHHPFGHAHTGGFANGTGNANRGGWGDVDWARWQGRFGGGEGMEGQL